MFDNLTGLGYGIITFAIIIGVGSIVLYNFAGSQACTSGFTWNSTANNCYNITNTSDTTANAGTSYTNVNYLLGQLGTSGLAGWTPAIIAFAVGMMFLGAFFIKGGRNY